MDALPKGIDVAVIGAGSIGCACALRLAQAGAKVAVIDRAGPGREASWAAAGILGAQAEPEGPGPMLELGVASRALFPELAAELREKTGIDLGLSLKGVLKLAFDPEGVADLSGRVAWQRDAGVRAKWIGPEQARRLGAPDAALGGLWLPDDGCLDPRALAKALAVAAERTGARFVRAEAKAIEERKGRVAGVQLGAGALLEAKVVVVAAGSWSGQIPGARIAAGAVRPVRGQAFSLPLPARRFEAVLFSMGAPRGYAVPRADRVVIGVTVEEAGFEKAVTPAGLAHLAAVAARLVPGVKPEPLETWSGLRPGSRDGLPLLGKLASGPEGLIVATGHYRNGVLLAPLTGELVRDLALGRKTRFNLAPLRPDRFA